MSQATYKITIPTSLEEIPLIDYLEWDNVSGDDDEERQIQALKIFCGVTESHIRERLIPIKTLNEIILKLSDVLNQSQEHKTTFELNGVKYGFIPNLDEISTGEFIDLETYLKEPQDLWKAMSILYRPITKEGQGGMYEIESYNARVNEAFKFMPTSIAIGARVFFYTLGADLLDYTLKYLESQMKEQVTHTDSMKNGDGSALSISYVMEMSRRWRASQHYPFHKPFYGVLTNQTLQRLNVNS